MPSTESISGGRADDDVRPAVHLYTASWCSVCKVVSPRASQIAGEFPDVRYEVRDVEAYPSAVRAVPTLIVEGPDGELGRRSGQLSSQAIRSSFEAARDASRVRGRIDATTRAIRVGAAVALVGLGLASSAPPLLIAGALAAVWGLWDLALWR